MKRDRSDDRDEVVTLGNTRDMQSTSAGSLVHLDDLDDVKVSDGAPDVRGWEVKGSDGEKIGKVSDLLVDTGAMKVRYLEVRLDKDVAKEAARTEAPHAEGVRGREDDDMEPYRHVLVPIGAAHLDDDADEVHLGAQAQALVGIPSYRRGSLTRDYERGLVGSFTSAPADRAGTTSREESGDFYAGAHFDDRGFLGRRRPVRDDMGYLSTKSGTARASGTLGGGGPLLTDSPGPQLDPRPGGVGDSRL